MLNKDSITFTLLTPILNKAELDVIHKAAGPGKAAKFMKGAILAGVNGDTRTLEELTAQAKANLPGVPATYRPGTYLPAWFSFG